MLGNADWIEEYRRLNDRKMEFDVWWNILEYEVLGDVELIIIIHLNTDYAFLSYWLIR